MPYIIASVYVKSFQKSRSPWEHSHLQEEALSRDRASPTCATRPPELLQQIAVMTSILYPVL